MALLSPSHPFFSFTRDQTISTQSKMPTKTISGPLHLSKHVIKSGNSFRHAKSPTHIRSSLRKKILTISNACVVITRKSRHRKAHRTRGLSILAKPDIIHTSRSCHVADLWANQIFNSLQLESLGIPKASKQSPRS
jgi:hypothetical protein